MFSTSSRPRVSSSVTEATMTRAEAPPIAPDSRVSANCTVWASGRQARWGPRHRGRGRKSSKARRVRSAPRKRVGQRHQLRDLGAAAPDAAAPPGRPCLKRVDIGAGLGRLGGVGRAQRRDQQEGGDVGGQAPEQAVGDLAPALESEQGLGLEQARCRRDRIRGSPPGSQPDFANEGSSRV